MRETGLKHFFDGSNSHYVPLLRLTDFCNEPIEFVARHIGKARRPHIVLDASHEGYGYNKTWRAAADRAREHFSADIFFVQTNPQFAIDAGGSGHSFGSFHHHVWRLLTVSATAPVLARARANLDRVPMLSALCLNNAPRPHRLLALETLHEVLPDDSFRATLVMLGERKLAHALAGLERESDIWHFDEPISFIIEDLLTWVDTGTSHNMVQLVDSIDTTLYEDTFFSLVTETEMQRPGQRRYTEKSLKPLLMGHPVVILGNQSVVRQLEALGFDLLRDQIDHSYDDLPNPAPRFRTAMASALRLCRLSIPERAAFLARNRARLRANIDLFDGPLLATLSERWRKEMAPLSAP